MPRARVRLIGVHVRRTESIIRTRAPAIVVQERLFVHRVRFSAPIACLAAGLISAPTSAPADERAAPAARLAVFDTPQADNTQEPLPDLVTPVRLTDRGRIELHVVDMPLAKVLQMLSLEGRRNIVASPDIKGTVTADLYGVDFEEALEAILVANGAGYRKSGSFIFVYTQAELARIEEANARKPYTQIFPLNYISAADAETYITPLLDEDEKVAVSPPASAGLSSSAESAGGYGTAGGDFLVVTARPAVIAQIERVLRQLDVRPRQVLVEATILRAELTDDNALGIDFSIVGGVDLEMLGATSNGITDITLGALPTERYERFNSVAMTDVAGDIPSGGLTLGIIKDHVGVFLRALEQVTETTVVANPKVLALNKQKGQVIVGRRDGYLTTTVTETQAVQQVEFLETGTRLIFRPFIGSDGFVRVELHPEDSVGFVNAQGLPSEQTTEVTTNVIVRDGETILIGGLFREVTTDARKQVPGLGGIPGIGQLFRSNSDSTSREEVIILLTMHVVKDNAAYVAASREQFEHVERIRVGLREGLMWHGRARIAQRQYQKALEHYKAGDTARALWHVNLALHNNGRMVPALQLKERIIGQRAWEEDGAGGRSFIYHLISQTGGSRGTLFGRPRAVPPPGLPAETKRDKEE
ncbi:MAG: type II secretion system protein GspD [Phycisphaerae bacterium]